MAALVVVTLTLTDIAHGGTCVGRHDGAVVFVRGGIPGEVVKVAITEQTKRFWRGEVVEVVQPSADRVDAPCPIAGECGGCDFQHVAPSRQRQLKAQVVKAQLARLAGLEVDVRVESIGDPFGWRTTMRYHPSDRGSGLRAWRSHDVVTLPDQGCLLAHEAGRDIPLRDPNVCTVRVAGSGLAVDGRPQVVREAVLGESFEVSSTGFWQVHPQAANTLVTAVLQVLDVQPGERALDLYCGVGLFSQFLALAGAQVEGVEGDKVAVSHARRNVPGARFHCRDVAKHRFGRWDVVVLDPPRAGAGPSVVGQIVRAQPRKVAYVSCDPATLARDLATFAELGYQLESLRAFDAFPNTHHVECVAGLVPR